jgi:hypothetical protein
MAKSASERRDDLIAAKTKAVEVAEKKAASSQARLAKAQEALDVAKAKAAPAAAVVAQAKAELEWAQAAPVAAPVTEDVDTFDAEDDDDDEQGEFSDGAL